MGIVPDITTTQLLLALCMFMGAALYTSVGHAGASAYIAAMALFGIPAATMRPTALVLNVLVASFGAFRFIKAGFFRWRGLWPFLVGALPMAFLGGYLQLPGTFYKPLVGVVLLIAAARLLWPKPLAVLKEWQDPPIAIAIPAGAAIGFLSGLTGTGGGIFLTPLLLFMAWSETKTASGVSVVFILANSVAGLLGNYASLKSLPAELPIYMVAVMAGAMIGTQIGIHKFAREHLLKALGVVLVIAGVKLIGAY
jgi:uncharacterized membrane protein YfcA